MKSPLTLSLTSTALTVIALILILLIPLCSIRSDPNHLSTLQFATIDASATKVTVNDNEYIGLPDPYDFSKHKQIYQMYLLNYCSGYKRPGSKELVIDFCSKNGKELWDILPSWKMWGVSVRSDGTQKFEWLRQGPTGLYIVYLVAIIMLGLNILGTFAMLHTWRWGKWIIFAVSAVSPLKRSDLSISI
ncbi:hypothetical protein AA0119_g13405 [Alternaria tenuissima]|jgi:hypothetical protein|uniref:Uncharacterized protein n=2 Tax=Alternaria alternata complex TaxID=187734 RepID=A0A4V1WPY3_ALTAL|nr:hypothetical protein AA0115_g12036 [Alternaria tenuissima]RYN64903.1 hypothetical protein AA0117_g12334 [Alternaria alternata]RYN82571.1 hypothetical protein AA0119_g13405 [Alternaria tenuissima]RYO00261.1 hypothetical protein AA0121_g13426 [Alternaria tenuissima]